MKRTRIILVVVTMALLAGGLWVIRRQATRETARQAWQAQHAAELAQARKQAGRLAALHDPQAREALSLVGKDAKAREVWVLAINNPDLPSNERKDLIEDLNEEGFRDPKNLTPEDLPLILSRIAMVEELAPKAMDNVNADAFEEAYKDLTNMRDRLVRK